jgi:hypothetical protein
MGVLSESHSSSHIVVVQDTQCAKMNSGWVVIGGKAETVGGFEPTVICGTSGISWVKFGFHLN